MIVEILGWQKFNARKDIKVPSWFRFDHGFFENPDFFNFTHSELLVWIYLLTLASKKSSSLVLVNFIHAERIGRLKKKDIYSAIDKLQEIQTVLVHERVRTDTYANNTDAASTLHYITDTTLHNNTSHHTTAEFDFESIYKKYPRKLGKQEGIKKARKEILAEKDYNALSTAVDRYIDHVRRANLEEKYIKHFSTFMTSWRDWEDPDAGTVKDLSSHRSVVMEEIEREEEAAAREAERQRAEFEREFGGAG